MKFKSVIFDLDGTLLNTIDDLTNAGNYVCRLHGWPDHTVDEFKHFVGNGMSVMTHRFMPEEADTEEMHARALQEVLAYYDIHKADCTAPYPGLPQAVSELERAGIHTAVLSNKTDSLARDVVAQYFPGQFLQVQGAVDGQPTKPDPTLLRALMQRMGASVDDTLFVGDSNVDIRTAKNGGLTSCGVLWGFRTRNELEAEGADYIVDDPRQLVDLILEK